MSKCVAEKRKLEQTVELESSSSAEADMDLFATETGCSSDLQNFHSVIVMHQIDVKFEKKGVITPELASALDRNKISD